MMGMKTRLKGGVCDPEKELTIGKYDKREFRYGRGPFTANGVPISFGPHDDCCESDPCYCRSDVIFYNGQAYDQKPYLPGRLRTRPSNVLFYHGKLVPPFGPGKSPLKYGPQFHPDAFPLNNCYNSTEWGKRRNPCCNSSTWWAKGVPYGLPSPDTLAYTDMGLPHGNTIGYFRFKPERICYEREPPIQRYEDCCNCDEPYRYNPSFYTQDECPEDPAVHRYHNSCEPNTAQM